MREGKCGLLKAFRQNIPITVASRQQVGESHHNLKLKLKF